ncbi:SagB/ThcOx family dehydrogenase [Geosporobacter ferrireducens]|uniref:Nitroreductase n=1 Tax=Geosporobacter ferrireducens TaxID=1424294 RepID=A0A1D8GNJ3_9FIRM|nr:SagB/ThcOx family dehydrogenase [Geosporobacter ferrireducens]AOT72455.1 nitroreductase [Geosporobacter ferrireducens]MTI56283.1 SagB/ThcOx family dehydrogenase [Geosporobacter ferrireducens]
MREIGKLFMEKTRYAHLEESDQEKGMVQPPLEKSYDPDSALIALPSVDELDMDSIQLKELIENRKSLRKYHQEALDIKELSYLLWSTQGVKKVLVSQGEQGPISKTLRTVPSAGGRHPFETYILINRVRGIRAGLYRYVATKHSLLPIEAEEDIGDKITDACLNQVFVKTSAVTFIWAADAYRTTWRYGERGYRYIHLDAGHVCQNLYLAAESIDCGVCAIAAFDDEVLNEVMGLDGENEFVVYIGTAGKKIK